MYYDNEGRYKKWMDLCYIFELCYDYYEHND